MQLDFTTLPLPDDSLWRHPLLPARFWAKVNPFAPLPPHCPELGACWVWTGHCIRGGYGRISRSDQVIRMALAHRVSYAALVAPIPEGLHVLHHCDNPPCVRPSHLFTGTHTDNMVDCARKGRNNPPRGERHWSITHPERRPRGERHGSILHPERLARGERHGSAKLTAADVLEIRRLARKGVTKAVLARQFGVGQTTVGKIIRRELWRHV